MRRDMDLIRWLLLEVPAPQSLITSDCIRPPTPA